MIIYPTEKVDTGIDIRLQGESVWLTRCIMAELFHATQQNIILYPRRLPEKINCKKIEPVRNSYRFGRHRLYEEKHVSITPIECCGVVVCRSLFYIFENKLMSFYMENFTPMKYILGKAGP